MTNIPIIDKTKQKNDFSINNSNWQIAHSFKSSNKREIESMDIHLKTSNKFIPEIPSHQIDKSF